MRLLVLQLLCSLNIASSFNILHKLLPDIISRGLFQMTSPARTGKVLSIAVDDDPILKIVAQSVDDHASDDIQSFISDMIVTMYDAKGIGLAAPQVQRSLRIIVFYLPAARDDIHHIGVPETVVINPQITPLDDSRVEDYEGCLSVPGYRGKVSRYQRIRYTGINRYGEVIDQIAEGWHARLVQHECDHLNGVLYPELMAAEDKLMTIDEWRETIKAR
jgi:peptide deformylase